jgi:hypothetical protein
MTKSRKVYKGGGVGYEPGVPVKGIETFLPSLIPDLAIWIKADSKFLKTESILSYAQRQPYFVQEALLAEFKDTLTAQVITEITSDTPATPNSFIPLNLDEKIATIFPALRIIPKELDAINISNYKDPNTQEPRVLQLISTQPISSESVSSFSISYGITVSKNTITNQVLLTAEYIATPMLPTTTAPVFSEEPIPSAELSEFVLFSRTLNPDETSTMEGYLAYKQNTQYALAADHPYLPNMIGDPIFSTIATAFKGAEQNLLSASSQIDVASSDYTKEHGEGGFAAGAPLQKAAIQGVLAQIAAVLPILSKGYLYARRINSIDINTIYRAINEFGWVPAGSMSDAYIAAILQNSIHVLNEANTFIQTLVESYAMPFVKQTGGAAPITTEISDHLIFAEQSKASNQLYQDLRVASRQIQADGDAAYNDLQNALKQDIESFVDTILHQVSDTQVKSTAILNQYTPIKTAFATGSWLQNLPNVDSTRSDQGYSDPALNGIHNYYIYVSTQINQGDYAYLLGELKEIKDSVVALSNASLNPMWREVYMLYLNEQTKKAKEYYDDFNVIYADLNQYISNINSFLTMARETGQVTTFSDPVDSPVKYQSTLGPLFLRKAAPLDSLFFGLDCITTDASGLTMEIHPFFPEFVPYVFVNSVYTKTTPFLTTDGTAFTQTINMLDPLTESVYAAFSVKPSFYNYSVSSLLEIGRDQMNAIHSVECGDLSPPILLPKLVLDKGSWVAVYNSGTHSIAVRNPAAIGIESIDVLGANQGFLYIYTEGSTAYYGRKALTPNQIPYDTLLACPRTSLCMYIDELGTSIYVRQTGKDSYEPVYTVDSYLVETVKDADGNVYDIDDIYKTNPYKVTSIPRGTNLSFHSQKKRMVKIVPQQFEIAQDLATGLAVLINPVGAIGVNEFGFCKLVRVPIQIIGDAYKIRGAYGDIEVLTTGATVTHPYRVEPFLQFQTIFRTRFVSPGTPNIFVSNSMNPIVNPNGIIVQVPQLSEDQQNYLDISGYGPIVMVPAIPQTLPTGLYPYMEVGAIAALKNRTDFMQQIALRYSSIKSFLQSEIMKVRNSGIENFGGDAVAAKTDTLTSFQNSLTSLETNDATIAGLTPSSDLSGVDANLTKALNTLYRVYKQGEDVIQSYLKGITTIKSIKEQVIYWNTQGASQINFAILEIQKKTREIATASGATILAETQDLLSSAVESQTTYNLTLQKCMNYIRTPPTLVSEVAAWATSIQPSLSLLDSLHEEIFSDLEVELPQILHRSSLQQASATISATLQSSLGQIQSTLDSMQSQKTAFDTYSLGVSPDQLAAVQARQASMDTMFQTASAQYTALYKQSKVDPSQTTLKAVQSFQTSLSDVQTNMQSLIQMTIS